MLKNSEAEAEIIWCECCGKKPVQGLCIINGVRRNLTKLCRFCFMYHPEDKIQGTKKNRSANFFHHSTEGIN
jgi:hypothetical protein